MGAQMKGEVKGADELGGCIVAQGSEKAATPHYHFYKAA